MVVLYANPAKSASCDSAIGREVEAAVGVALAVALSTAVGIAHACANKAPRVRMEMATMVAS